MSKVDHADRARKRRDSVRQGARRVTSAIAARRRLNATRPPSPKTDGASPGRSAP